MPSKESHTARFELALRAHLDPPDPPRWRISMDFRCGYHWIPIMTYQPRIPQPDKRGSNADRVHQT